MSSDHPDPASLLEAVRRERPKLVFLANPDNPMGSWWPAHAVQALVDAVPMDTVLVLDEAYIEFAPPGTAPDLDVSRPNVIRYRTFSKAYGMTGARIAYAIAEASVAEAFDKIRNHFSVNRIAQAGAPWRRSPTRPILRPSSRRLPAHPEGSVRSHARMVLCHWPRRPTS